VKLGLLAHIKWSTEMRSRTLIAVCVAAAFAVPVNAAQAGPLLDRVKNTVKNEAKLAVKVTKVELRIAKDTAECAVRAATKKPCALIP
jgi:hypothetical protein